MKGNFWLLVAPNEPGKELGLIYWFIFLHLFSFPYHFFGTIFGWWVVLFSIYWHCHISSNSDVWSISLSGSIYDFIKLSSLKNIWFSYNPHAPPKTAFSPQDTDFNPIFLNGMEGTPGRNPWLGFLKPSLLNDKGIELPPFGTMQVMWV